MEEKSLKDPYFALKKKICWLVFQQPFTLQLVKDFYKSSINSNRSLSRVSNLDSILSLLEERDLLSERNVTALHCLGELLKNQGIIVNVQVYSKVFLYDSEATCDLCGFSCSYEKFLEPQADVQQNQVSNFNNNRNSNYVDELGEAIKNISLRVDKKQWKILARHLDIDECTIDEICRNNPNNSAAQAQVALAIWRQRPGATISVLDNALEQRYCKKKGLGVHLRKPLVNPVEVICLSN